MNPRQELGGSESLLWGQGQNLRSVLAALRQAVRGSYSNAVTAAAVSASCNRISLSSSSGFMLTPSAIAPQ